MSYIVWKERNSNELTGLIISDLPSITKPQLKTNIIEIDGVDGDIVEELGYKSYIKTVNISLRKIHNIDDIINYFQGKGRLVLSNEANKYYKAQIIESIDYNRLLDFRTASVRFSVQPYKYLLDEKKVIKNITTEKEVIVENKGLEKAKPIIEIIGKGNIELSINDLKTCDLKLSEENEKIIIDSENQEAYNEEKLLNNKMLGKFPFFNPGKNKISWSGNIEKISITPNSRWL